jgi:hypothetical protein
MTATLATAAVLLVPFLAVVFVGGLAVAVHDAIARAWAGRSTTTPAASSFAAGRRAGAPRAGGRRGAPVVLARSGAAARRPARRAPVVLVR